MHILLSCTMYYKVLLKTFSESQSSFFLPKALCHSPLVSSTASVLFSILLKDCVLAALTTSKANIFNSFLPRHKQLCKKYFKNVESILWGSAITPWENITALILLLVSITGNVFPILWPFFFLLGNPIGGREWLRWAKTILDKLLHRHTHNMCLWRHWDMGLNKDFY